MYIYLFGVLRRFQHCTGHITTGSWKGRGNQYIQFVRVLYCKLPTNDKQLPAFPLEAVPGIEPRPQRWEARVLPLCHCGPLFRVYKPEISNLHIVTELCQRVSVSDFPCQRVARSGILPVNAHAEVNILNLNYIYSFIFYSPNNRVSNDIHHN